MFDLLFDGKKISSFQQLMDNFDFEAVKLYCLGGSLSSWLDQCGESEIAAKVRSVNLYEDIDTQIADIFGQPAPIRVNIQKAQVVNNIRNALSSFVAGLSYAITANSGSFLAQSDHRLSSYESDGSFSAGSGFFLSCSYTNMQGSFEYNVSSFEVSTGSFRIGSGYYEYESEYEIGSFQRCSNSFSFEQSSFYSVANSFSLANISFTYETTSYLLNISSFNLGSFNSGLGLSSFSPSSFSPSSFDASLFSAGSFGTNYIDSGNRAEEKAEEDVIPKTAEEKIRKNLTYSPLNRYGYGIHLI